MNAMESRLDQRMASLYGNPHTYDKVCSRKFGNTLAKRYREDVRQLAHCVSMDYVLPNIEEPLETYFSRVT